MSFTSHHYCVAVLCALRVELLAVRALFDEEHQPLKTAKEDTNHYSLGRMGGKFVVATCLPSGEYGTNAASAIMLNLQRSFPRVEYCLLVGIGGGVPSPTNDVRLGDVVVSHPDGAVPAVVQYDMGKMLENEVFNITGILRSPPRLLMTAIASLRSRPNEEANSLQYYIEKIGRGRPAYQFPGRNKDILFATNAPHQTADDDCRSCHGDIVNRPDRPSDEPKIFYGPIGSGNKLIKSARYRDYLRETHKIMCFEMEAAGVMNLVPCLVIRGICDYADSHKNKVWQEYAAATAAAYAMLLLCTTRNYKEANGSPFMSFEARPIYENENRLEDLTRPTEEGAPSRSTQAAHIDESPELCHSIYGRIPKRSPAASCRRFDLEYHPDQTLQKVSSFAKRDPSWNPWPKDKYSLRLFDSISGWITDPNCKLLTVGGALARSISELPTPANFACHVIQFLRSQTVSPIIWLFSSMDDRHNPERAFMSLISQALDLYSDIPREELSINETQREEATEEQLCMIFARILPFLHGCFIVIEMKDAALAGRLEDVFHRTFENPGANFKAMIVSYNMRQKDYRHEKVRHAIMPAIKLRGSQPNWDGRWNSLKAQFT